MPGTDAGWPADVEFVEYVQARQRTLLRAAYLVCGDALLAEDLVQRSLTMLARQWERVRDEQPDAFVRRILYRDAVASSHGNDREVVGHEPPGGQPAWDEPDDTWDAEDAKHRLEVLRALDELTPRQRATVVLRWFEGRGERDAAEILGCSVGTVRSQTHDARTRLRVALPGVDLEMGGHPMTTDLRDLLELTSDDLPEVDFAVEAWERARRRHRAVVRRTVLGVGVVAAGAIAAVVVREPEPLPPPRPLPTGGATIAADGRLPSVQVDGVRVFLAPDPRSESRLPRYPEADSLALPRHLGAGVPAARAALGEDGLRGVPEKVRTVLLVTADGGGRHPVLHAPAAPSPHVLVPSVTLPEGFRPAAPLGTRAISDDRHRIVFHAPGRLLVLDARDGSVVEVEVPDPTLTVAGWARDGATLVARGRDDGWLVDPQSGAVRRGTGPVNADWADLAGEDGAVLRTFSGVGELTGRKELRGPAVVPYGMSSSNTEGWVAGGAFLPGPYQEQVVRSQGLVAVQGDLRPTPRVLAATQSALVPKQCYRALTWGPRGVILFESRSERPGFQGTVRRILAWDVLGARLWHVCDVDAAGTGVGEFVGAYTL